MDPEPGAARRSKRLAVAIAGIFGAAVLIAAGLLVAGIPAPASTASPGGIAAATPSTSPAPAFHPTGSAEPTALASLSPTVEPSAMISPTASATPGATSTRTPVRPTATPFHPPTVTFTKPNLEFAYHPAVPSVICGVPYTLSAIVRNSGQRASVFTSFALFDQYPDLNTVAEAWANVPPLAPGDSTTVSVTFTVSSACGQTHTLRLRIDASGLNDETDEDDNFLTMHHVPRGPNLYPTDLTVPAHPACASVTVGVRVNNNGSVQANSGLVKFTDTYSGAPGYSKSVYVSFPNIPAGTSRIVSQTFPALQYCNHMHTITAVVDAGRTIPETSETDNTMHVTYHPDL